MQGEETEDDWDASLEDEMAKKMYVYMYCMYVTLCVNGHLYVYITCIAMYACVIL